MLIVWLYKDLYLFTFKDIEHTLSIYTSKTICAYVNTLINRSNMGTTVAINDEAYRLVIDKQNEMLKNTGKKARIHEIVSDAVIKGIEFVGKG